MAIEMEVAHLYTTLEMSMNRWVGEIGAAQARWDAMASQMEGRAERAKSTIGGIFSSIGRGISTGIGIALGGDVFSAITGGMRTAVMGASDLAETTDAVSRRMGSAFPQVIAFAGQLEDQFGLTQGDTLQAAGAFGAFGRQLGMQGPALAGFSNQLVQLAADFSSFENLSMREASDKITSALAGETEPMRRYGVMLSENTIKQYAYAKGISQAGSELTEQQKVIARAGAMMEQMRDRANNLQETQGSFANQLRKLTGMTKVSLRELGVGLSPISTSIVTGLATNAAGVAAAVKAARPAIEAFSTSVVEGFGRARAAVVEVLGSVSGPLADAWSAVSAWGVRVVSLGGQLATWAANVLGYSSVVEALGGVLDFAGRMFESVRGAAGAFWNGLVAVGDAIARAIGQTDLLGMATSAAGTVLQFVAEWYGRYPGLISAATSYVTGLAVAFNAWLGDATGYATGLDAIAAGVVWITDTVASLPAYVTELADQFDAWLGNATGYATGLDAIAAALEWASGWLEWIPGFVASTAVEFDNWLGNATGYASGLQAIAVAVQQVAEWVVGIPEVVSRLAAAFDDMIVRATGYESTLQAIGETLKVFGDAISILIGVIATGGGAVVDWLLQITGFTSPLEAIETTLRRLGDAVGFVVRQFEGLAKGIAETMGPAVYKMLGNLGLTDQLDFAMRSLGMKTVGERVAANEKATAAVAGGGWVGGGEGGGWGPAGVGGGWAAAPGPITQPEWGAEGGGAWLPGAGAGEHLPLAGAVPAIPLPEAIDPFQTFAEKATTAAEEAWGGAGKPGDWLNSLWGETRGKPGDWLAGKPGAAGMTTYPDQLGLDLGDQAKKAKKSDVFVGLTEYAKKIQVGAMESKLQAAQLKTADNTASLVKHSAEISGNLRKLVEGPQNRILS